MRKELKIRICMESRRTEKIPKADTTEDPLKEAAKGKSEPHMHCHRKKKSNQRLTNLPKRGQSHCLTIEGNNQPETLKGMSQRDILKGRD